MKQNFFLSKIHNFTVNDKSKFWIIGFHIKLYSFVLLLFFRFAGDKIQFDYHLLLVVFFVSVLYWNGYAKKKKVRRWFCEQNDWIDVKKVWCEHRVICFRILLALFWNISFKIHYYRNKYTHPHAHKRKNKSESFSRLSSVTNLRDLLEPKFWLKRTKQNSNQHLMKLYKFKQ